ncbi:MAG: hypothetical protein IJ572_03245 [Bacilli bacterium]|nr:hypothetical protein [Bacilli bacterium]
MAKKMELNIQLFEETGFDPVAVNDCLSGVRTAYNNMCTNLGGAAQKLVEDISNYWGSTRGQEAFRDVYAPQMDSYFLGGNGVANGVDGVFESLLTHIASAGNTWAQELHDGSTFSAGFASAYNKINISSINSILPSGVVGADIEACTSTINSSFERMSSELDSSCNELRNAVSVSGLVDAGKLQQAAVDNAVNTLNDAFRSVLDTVRQGLTAYLNQENNVHEETASKVASENFNVE